jgi:PAS domain S-box-containing protein
MDNPRLHLFHQDDQNPLVTVPSNTPMAEVIYLMSQAQTSCVLILEQQQLIGIFTERDVVRAIANQVAFADMTVGELMSQPVITLSETEVEDLTIVLQRFREHSICHLPVIDAQGQVLGVVTPGSVRDAWQPSESSSELVGILPQSSVLQTLNPIELCEVITTLRQIVDTKTAELEQEIRRRQQLTNLLSAREAHYRTSEARLNDILNSAIATSIVSFRVFPNYDWEYEYQSIGCENIFGYTAQEIMADQTLWMSRVHPQDRETVIMPLFADIFAERTSIVEFRFEHKDGSVRWIAATYTSRYSLEENCWIVTGISKNITDRKQAEAALRYSEERWQLAIAGTDEAIWDWNILTDQTFRSDRWFEMLGYQRHELSNWDEEWSNRIHPDDYVRVMAAQAAYMLKQTPNYCVEYRLRLKDGSYGWFRSRAKAVWDEAGNPIRLVGSLGNISDRKFVEIALQEREAMLRRIGDNLPNGAIYQIIRELDGSDRFSYMSGGIANLMEISAEDVLQDYSLLYRQVMAEDYPRLEAAINQSLRHLSVFDVQLRICTPSGKVKWLQLRSTPHQYPDHRVVWDGLIVDITDTKHIEETLRKSQALLEESQKVARLGNWEHHLETGQITWSKQLFKLFNRDPAQLAPNYQELLQLFYPEDGQKLAQAVERAASTGESYKLLLRLMQADNSITYIESIGHAQQNTDGKVIRLYGTAQDITERIQAEEKLRHSEARLATTQKIAHVGSWELELNTYKRSWSRETFRIFGLDPSQPEPTHAEFLQMVHPEDQAAVQTQFEQTIALQTPFSLEYRIIRPDGSIRYVESRAAYDTKNQVPKIFGAILDITERKQAELEIIHSRDLLQAVFNESADALFLVDPETLLTTDCNQQAVKMFGVCSKAELIGIEGYTLHKESFSAEEFAAYFTAINQEGFWSREIEYLTQQGTSFWGNLAIKRIRVAGKDMNLVRVTDISKQQAALRERKRAEAALAKSEEQLRLTLEFTQIGTWDWNVQTGEVIWNDNHYHLLGLDPKTSVARYQLWRDAIHPEDVNRVEQSVAIALQQHTNFADEYRVIYPDGSIHWLTGRGRGMYNETGEPIRMLGVILDISDRKHYEQMLELQAVMTRNMAEGLCLIRADDGVIVYTNPKFERMFGYESGELLGKHVSIVNYEDDQITAQGTYTKLAAAITKHGEATYEIHNVKKDGTPFWCSATTSVFGHPQYGRVFVAVQQDITEHKQAEEKIKASLREKEVLLQEIHHRVKNNLGIVSSLLQMQSRRTQDLQATAILRDSQNRIASIALVHEKLYRSDDLANIDFAQYIPDLTTHLFDSYNVSSNDIQLNIQVEDVSLDIETAIPCGLIINELVSNALKYAFPVHRAGEIQVRLSPADDHTLILIVRDNGVGLPTEFDSKKTKNFRNDTASGFSQAVARQYRD